MPDSNCIEPDELMKKLDVLSAKIEEVSNILGKFGLDFITKIGQTTLKISALSDKLDTLNKSTIDIKGLLPQLNKIIENQKNVDMELDLIKSLLQKSTSSIDQEAMDESVGRDTSVTATKKTIAEQFLALKERLSDINDMEQLRNHLEKIKDGLFEATGGHRILYEMSQYIKKLGASNLSEEFKLQVKDKIGFWVNKL